MTAKIGCHSLDGSGILVASATFDICAGSDQQWSFVETWPVGWAVLCHRYGSGPAAESSWRRRWRRFPVNVWPWLGSPRGLTTPLTNLDEKMFIELSELVATEPLLFLYFPHFKIAFVHISILQADLKSKMIRSPIDHFQWIDSW